MSSSTLPRRAGAAFFISFLSTSVASCTGDNRSIDALAPDSTVIAQAVSRQQRQTPAPSQTLATTNRHGFLGAFFRSIGASPYGALGAGSQAVAPKPYPTPGPTLFGSGGYCDAVSANGVSISSGYVVDATKLAHIVNLGVKWTRSTASALFDDQSHVFGPGVYAFGDLDSVECALIKNHISPVIGLEAGPVEYNTDPSTFSPVQVPTYKTAADFGAFCGAVALHERMTFAGTTRYSIPGNEVNTNPGLFPGGPSQVAAYSKACYEQIKANEPKSFVYGLELNMLWDINTPAYVKQLRELGCQQGNCYDGLSIHLTLRYPLSAPGTPCDNVGVIGGDYTIQCVADIRRAAARSALHVLIGEAVYPVPGMVPDESSKAAAVVASMKLFAQDPRIDGVNYANVDECADYTSGYFVDGCLVDTNNKLLPAYSALQALAKQSYQ